MKRGIIHLNRLKDNCKVFRNIKYENLNNHLKEENKGSFVNNGAYSINTGKYTGRSPNDRFIVSNLPSSNMINWGDINKKIKVKDFDKLNYEIENYFSNLDKVYIFDGYCGRSSKKHIRFITQYAWQHNFVKNMFIIPNEMELKELSNNNPDFTIINGSDLKLSNYKSYSLNSEAFVILNIERKLGIIGGTSYAGEMKKSIFSLMNYWLPQDNILTMHCSANIGVNNDTSIFFGLSGTGKTTLSADPNRYLIGDDEHGWNSKGIFNLEGGCYAKTINLDKNNEPDIFNAIKTNSLVENVYIDNNNEPDYFNTSITENGRVSYSLNHISNYYKKDIANHPKNIIFLTCDAFGILPPISKLNTDEAMYHFLSGYTAKVSGTERGIVEPKAVFSSCYGEPFLPLNPIIYGELLKKKILKHDTNVYLVNTGWYKGGYSVGERMNISLTRKCIDSILNNDLEKSNFDVLPIFNLKIPKGINGIDNNVLNPINTWDCKKKYFKESEKLALMFIENFERFGNNNEVLKLSEFGPKL